VAEHYDFIALGGGNAGLGASTRVAAAGRKVALVDPADIGGLCALRGCNPKKVLVRATEVLGEVRDAGEHGIATGETRIDWNRVIDRKHRFTDPATERAERGLAESDVELIRGEPRFVAPDRLQVAGRVLSFDAIVVATGSTPTPFSFPGAEFVRTSDDILELRDVPRRLVIIGAGAVAFEFAQAFARAGSDVHVLMRSARALRPFDEDLSARLVEHSRTLWITFHTGAAVAAVTPTAVRLADGSELAADFVLNAAGRTPQIADLGLEAAGVATTKRGVTVDDYLQSPGNPRVYAAGDAHGRLMLSPVASYEARIVAHNVLHPQARQKADYGTIPSAVFTVPPLARVGMTAADAREAGLDVDVALQDMSANTVFRIAHAAPAWGKLVCEKASGRVLGADLYHAGADDIVHLFALAIRHGISREQLGEMVYAYPTLTSGVAYLAV
jgi:glutathione reductase (NADPH)